jgi:histidyl-tRNA synthetase
VPQLFRYERQQRGRLREHFQLNFDIIGEEDVAADAELLAAAIDILRTLGLTAQDFVARVSDRRLLRALLLDAGVPKTSSPWRTTSSTSWSARHRRPSPRVLPARPACPARWRRRCSPSSSTRASRRSRGSTAAGPGIAPELERMERYFGFLREMGLGDFVRFDLTVVRGLAYYTGIVFELFDTRGELRAICGGGRYDDLLKRIAGVDLPALGFGMGDVVLTELLRDRKLLPDPRPVLDFYLAAAGPEQRGAGARPGAPASRRGALGGVLVRGGGAQPAVQERRPPSTPAASPGSGPDEVAAGEALVRDTGSGESGRIPLAELARP